MLVRSILNSRRQNLATNGFILIVFWQLTEHIYVHAAQTIPESLFYDYKEYFSMLMLAIVDASYKFIVMDIVSCERESDSGIFLNYKWENKYLMEHLDCAHFGSNIIVPHVIVGDETFKLS